MLRFHKTFSRFIAPTAVLILFVFSFLAVFLLSAHPVLAQAPGQGLTAFEQFGQTVRLGDASPIVIVARLIRIFLGLTGIILTVLVIYAGWLYMSSLGNPKKLEQAKKLLKNAVIGMFIIWFSFSLSWWFLNKLLGGGNANGSVTTAQRYNEPLKGSLGAGIINSHYPLNNAVDVPRNTKIFVEFKEAMAPASIVRNYVEGQQGGELNANNIKIFKTEEGVARALAPNQVLVNIDAAKKIFVFRPVNLLGDSQNNTNYSVQLLPGIQKANGNAAFSGAYGDGYKWSFQVGTEVDVTPPKITSVVPVSNANEPRNVTVEVTFDEAMDPVVSTGALIGNPPAAPVFTNIAVKNAANDSIQGSFEISNGYQTVDFTTTDACAQDPCGDTIYCLPGGQRISVTLTAAAVDPEALPQAILFGALPNGLTDASGNSLDGNADGKACQGINNVDKCPQGNQDGYSWSFNTSNEVNATVPRIASTNPLPNQGDISLTDPLTATFNMPLKASTIRSEHVSLWPQNYEGDFVDSWWFSSRKEDLAGPRTMISIDHPTLVAPELGAENYYPVFNQGLKSVYQICLFPAAMNGTACEAGVSEDQPYCCSVNGAMTPSATACRTGVPQNQELPLNR